jgi:hypothetical protein
MTSDVVAGPRPSPAVESPEAADYWCAP